MGNKVTQSHTHHINMQKPENVQIIQISTVYHKGNMRPETYGLGNDGNMYRWEEKLQEYWILNN